MMEEWTIQNIFSKCQTRKFWNIFLPKNLANDFNLIQIGIKFLIFQKINFSSKFRSAAARLDFSHLGTLLKLRNFRKCIIGKSLGLILPASFQIGIQYLLFPKINFSSKFRSAAARMAPSHLGALLKLRNLR